ncbi:MAG: signal peptide peptidase SppA [Deltaproteobacteria bacterium]
MRILRLLAVPIVVLWALIVRPLQIRARKRILKKNGWAELHLEGQVMEMRPVEKLAQQLVKRAMQREDPPRVVLARLRRFAEEIASDKHARGVLVRIDALSCGLASATAIRRELMNIRDAKKEVVVHLARNAGNLEMFVASAATKIYATPVGAIASVGMSSVGLFMAETLERIGVKIQVASRGRFKSAPDRFTRTERSDADREQTQALIDEVDAELATAIADGRRIPEPDAITMIDSLPMIGTQALDKGFIDGLARDEDLPTVVQTIEDAEEPARFVGAGAYLDARTIHPLFPRKRKRIGIVQVHGAIVDKAPPYQQVSGSAAVEKAVVDDLRTALNDKTIGAVVMHIDSRGGSVTASDAMYAAVKRLDQEKPVIACFADVSASGGYYVGCGARAIVCDPLTITGSIGVFAMIPTLQRLTEKIDLKHDVIENRKHASLFNLYRDLTPENREATDAEVEAMYERFLSIVGEARDMTRDEVDEVAQGRVWTGRAARKHRLVDGLGGMEEALGRARDACPDRLDDRPVLVTSKGSQRRPEPFVPAEAARVLMQWVGAAEVPVDLLTMMLTGSRHSVWAYAPLTLR